MLVEVNLVGFTKVFGLCDLLLVGLDHRQADQTMHQTQVLRLDAREAFELEMAQRRK